VDPRGRTGRAAGGVRRAAGRPHRPAPRHFLAFDEQLDRHHPDGTFHEHLAILAVRPDRQGQGTGTALLDARHAVLDGQGIPAYLEASDERTRRLYLAHGYVLRPDAPIRLPGGPEMWPMWREPRTRDRAR
jgi:GNAT superfamily N-acetyltransferase